MSPPVFVLTGGWPRSGKSTLAAGLAAELQVAAALGRLPEDTQDFEVELVAP
jgi:predicted kinase